MSQYLIRRFREQFDWTLLTSVSLLILMGILNLRSASLTTNSSAYVTQIVWLALGTLAAALVAAIDYRVYDRLAYVFYAVIVVLLALVLFIGKEINNSQRWLALGPFTLQPSELAKVSLLIVFAKYFHHTRRTEGYSLRDLMKPMALLAVPVILTLKEPDLGTSLVMVFLFFTLLAFERVRRRAVIIMVVSALISVPLAWKFGLKDYQRGRVLAFIHPDLDRYGAGWQSYQSLIAVGSGQLTGKGYTKSTQSLGRFLPYTKTDFILAAFAEEHGFLGVIVLLGLYLFIIFWSLRIAGTARDKFGAVIAVGVGAMFFWHVVLNTGMVLKLLPVVGVTLPLFSYGGSSVLAMMLSVGLLFNVSMRHHMF